MKSYVIHYRDKILTDEERRRDQVFDALGLVYDAERVIGAALLFPENPDVDKIINDTLDDLFKVYKPVVDACRRVYLADAEDEDDVGGIEAVVFMTLYKALGDRRHEYNWKQFEDYNNKMLGEFDYE